MNKSIITIVIVAVVVLGGYFLLRGTFPAMDFGSRDIQPMAPIPQTSNQQATPQPPVGQTPATKENAIIYTDAGYSPSTLTVKKGETVTFKNQSSQSMWTASAVHPTHRAYPTTGGCLGSTLDACKGVQPGNDWSFRFDISGTWKYHNHLSPGDTGTIVVE